MDPIGPAESRLLALERKQARLDRSLRDLSRRSIAAGQGIWSAWQDAGAAAVVAGGPPPAPAGPKIPGCANALAATLYCRDPVYGSNTLRWDGSLMWTACVLLQYPGYGLSCSAESSVAVHYDLMTTGIFRMRWVSDHPTTTQCPEANTACSDTPNCIAQQSNPIQIDSCVPFRAHMTVGLGGGFIIFGLAVNSGVRVDFSDSPF